MPRSTTVAALALPVVLLAAWPVAPARAGLSVCNRTLEIANVAVGLVSRSDGAERSEGWWVVAPNRCADVVTHSLEGWTVVLHAVDVRGGVLLEGEAGFCTAPRAFAIQGRADCWLRGHTKGGFAAVETDGAADWTVFLDETETP